MLEPVPAEKAAPITAALNALAKDAKTDSGAGGEARAIGFAVPATESNRPMPTFQNSADAPSCHECGSLMVRCAACYKCMNCGATSGCS